MLSCCARGGNSATDFCFSSEMSTAGSLVRVVRGSSPAAAGVTERGILGSGSGSERLRRRPAERTEARRGDRNLVGWISLILPTGNLHVKRLDGPAAPLAGCLADHAAGNPRGRGRAGRATPSGAVPRAHEGAGRLAWPLVLDRPRPQT